MSFHLSAEDIRVEDGHILKARLRNEAGEWQDSEIDLDQHIGNTNGTNQPYIFAIASSDILSRQLPLGQRR